MALTYTQANLGIRHNFLTYGDRCLEQDGVTQYLSRRVNLWWVDGNLYQVGQTLPYDVGGASYSKKAQSLLRLYWDNKWLTPTA